MKSGFVVSTNFTAVAAGKWQHRPAIIQIGPTASHRWPPCVSTIKSTASNGGPGDASKMPSTSQGGNDNSPAGHPQPHQLTKLVFLTLAIGTLKGPAQRDPPKYQSVTAAIESDLPGSY